MARLTIPDEQTFAEFTVVTSTTAFPITFSLFAKADITVLVDGTALEQSDFTFTGTLLDGGGYAGGTVTLNTAVDDVTVRIERNVAPARTSNFAPAASTPVGSVDQALNRLTAVQQDIDRKKLDAPTFEVAGKYLAFDAEGLPVASEGTGTDDALRADLAASTGASLVAYLAGTDATSEGIQTALRRAGIHPEQFGAEGDGATDDSAAFAAAFVAATITGAPVMLSPSKDYRCVTGLTAPAGLEMIGYAATISTAANITLLTLTTGCVVRGVQFTGPSSTYHVDSKGVYFSGTLNGAAVAPTFISGVRLIDCKFEQFGYAAILPRYDDGTQIINPTIVNCGYAGVLTEGSKNLVGKGGYFDTFTGETGTGSLEAQAITWSCADNETDHVRYPPSRACKWTGGMYRNVPTWAVLDTHGGEDCHFEGPHILDCRRAIWLASRNGAGPIRCSATNVVAVNTFGATATNSNGTSKRDAAFLIDGHNGANLAQDCHITGIATGYGSALDATTRPAAVIGRCDTACTMDITLINPYGAAIGLDADANGHIRAVIDNPQSAGAGGATTSPCYVAIIATGTDAGNVTLDLDMRRSKPGLNTYVGVRALVSSGGMANYNVKFTRLSFDSAIDMTVATDLGTVTGDYPLKFVMDVVGLNGVEDTFVTAWRRGDEVTVNIPLISGTSDSTTFSLGTTTPLPAYLRPADTRRQGVMAMDNGTNTLTALSQTTSAGAIVIEKDAAGTAMTASGTKRLYNTTLKYNAAA